MLNQQTKTEKETPLFYAMKFIKDRIDKKLMIKTLIELGANPSIKNHSDLYAFQAYNDDYGLDEAAICIEKAVFLNKNKKKFNEIGSVFTLNHDISKATADEVKAMIFDNWRDFIKDKPFDERLKDDLEVIMNKKQKIIDKFNDVQNVAPLDANKEFNDTSTVRRMLKEKQLEIACKNVIDSFERYH